jgi:outer membrane protein assembly factor BamB
MAIDRKTGKTRWTTKRETYLAGYATPCVRTLENGQQELIVLDSAFGLTGVDLQSGDVNWQTKKLLPTRTVASPVMAGDLIFGSHGRGTTGELLSAVRAGSKTKAPKVEYEIRKSAPLTPTLIVKDDLAFLWSDNGVVTCLVAETGEQVWKNRVGGSYYASPVWVDGRLYCTDRMGNVTVIAAGREFKLIAKVPLDEASFATPAIANGVMYLRTETRLFSLGGRRAD